MNTRWLVSALLSLATAVPSVASTTPSSRLVEEVGTAYLDWQKEEDLFLRLKFGLPVEKLPDVSAAKVERDAARAQALLARLAPVVAADLSHEETLSHDILRRQLGALTEAPRLHWFSFPVTPYASPIGGVNRAFSTFRLSDEKSAGAYLSLARQLPAFYGGLRAKLEAQAARGIRIPRAELDLVVPFLRSQIAPLGGAEQGPYGVAAERLAALSAAQAQKFRGDLTAILDQYVAPQIAGLADWLAGDYRNTAPETVGLSQYPGGPEAYAWLVRWHTTLDVTPEEVHRIGIERVAAIEAEMAQLRQRIGFAGTQAEFRARLKSDPKLFPKSAEEIGERLMSHIRRIEPKVDAYFLTRPKAAYGVRRLAPELEPGQTFGFYNPPTASDAAGTYYYNGSQLADRSLLNAAGLIYHELVPDHHFQITLAYENAALPAFRRETFDTAYTEGWGEYASELAGEMGMYGDPYDQYGRLAMEMFVTTRLVVDTGMNALGWSRDRAVAFMRDHLMETDTQIHTESLRYSCDIPGQALAYKMGAVRIRELRERARAELGARFDVRRFHDAILGSGSLPMTTLERHVAEFVAREKKRR
jgi:uncharacterized protein (DUF885 family)